MNILAVHSGHDTNMSYIEDGELLYFNKSERLSGIKRDNRPPEEMFIYPEVRDFLSNKKFNTVVYGTPYNSIRGLYDRTNHRWKKAFPLNIEHILFDDHHLSHAANAFYGSGFNSSYVLVIDRNGSFDVKEGFPSGCQTETLYYCEYPNKFEKVFSNHSWLGITGKYALISYRIGFGEMEGGKTMGLSSYGKYRENAYTILSTKFKVSTPDHLNAIIGDSKIRHDFLMSIDPTVSLEDLAKTIQVDTTNEILELIDNIDFTRSNNLCFTGGHAQNCMLNSEIAKANPNINFYVDPIPDDSGCSIGYAKYTWYDKTKSMNKNPLKDVFFAGV
jgi:hypothetical protein